MFSERSCSFYIKLFKFCLHSWVDSELSPKLKPEFSHPRIISNKGIHAWSCHASRGPQCFSDMEQSGPLLPTTGGVSAARVCSTVPSASTDGISAETPSTMAATRVAGEVRGRGESPQNAGESEEEREDTDAKQGTSAEAREREKGREGEQEKIRNIDTSHRRLTK